MNEYILPQFPDNLDVNELNNRLERLSIDFNTHFMPNLRRQDTRPSLSIKSSITYKKYLCISMETHQILFNGELAFTRTVVYRCLSIHQLLVFSIPHIPLFTEDHIDISRLIFSDELLRTLSLLQKPTTLLLVPWRHNNP